MDDAGTCRHGSERADDDQLPLLLRRGLGHTIVGGDDLYLEDSARGLGLIDWLDDMINRPFAFGSDWRNASCFPNCAP